MADIEAFGAVRVALAVRDLDTGQYHEIGTPELGAIGDGDNTAAPPLDLGVTLPAIRLAAIVWDDQALIYRELTMADFLTVGLVIECPDQVGPAPTERIIP